MKKYLYTTLLLLLGAVAEVFPQSKTISGGNDHGLIICAQGYLYTWGNNFSDVIGGPLLGIDPDVPGNTPDARVVYSPQRVKTGNLTFSMVTSGSGAFNLALSCHNVVYAWGEDSQHGCGQGANTASAIVKYPVPVLKGETDGYTEDGQPGGDYLGGVTYIAASTNSGFAIMDDGRVVGWGNGSWNPKTGAAAAVPAYIKDKAGNDLQNITHISGGDDNCLLRDADGNLYGIGPWNGSGSNVTTTYAVPVVMEETGEPLKDIRMSAAGDVCGFAVTGDGYVWSWGNGGWGGSTGQSKNGLNHYGALRVCSGEYETISGEEYLTDVKEVIGGRGHGAAVTKEGYLVYWGCNENNGGVAPATNIPADYKSGSQGVKPILARYCDASGKPGELVKDAVSISRGDNFDFMVNDKDEFYVWGLNDLGQAGTGDKTVETYNCLIKLETIPCEIQDGCPEVFMIDRLKCPGEMIELDCGFVVPKGKEDRYYVQWFLNDELLNTSELVLSNQGTPTYDKSYDNDPYNKAAIEITEPGRYKVIVYYVGVNIPCDACEPDSIEIEVTDMNMPIDTIITTMNCVAEPLKPTSSDNICFEAVVNDKFYNSKQNVTFAAFSTVDSKDTLEIIETTGGGGEISFCVTGDKIAASEVHDNSGDLSKDTTYTIWLEDLTSFETYLFKNQKAVDAGSFQSYGILLDLYSDSDLKSFDIFAKGYSGTSEISATPVIYTVAKDENGKYYPDKVFWTGEAQTFEITSDEPNQLTVECGVRLTGMARGTRYILGMNFNGNCNIYVYDTPARKQNMPDYITPIEDSEGFGIFAMGATANGYSSNANGADKSCYTNIKFGKLTDYDCGRIELQARYGCPPCNMPTGNKVTIESTTELVANAEGVKTVALCNDSDPITLSVKDVVKQGAKFDILWYKESLSSTAVLEDSEKSASSYPEEISWKEDLAGKEVKYYVQVRDSEKPTASTCFVYDSVIVIYNEIPKAPVIEIEPFCESLDGSEKTWLTEILSGADFDGYEVNWYADSKMSATATEPVLADLAAVKAGNPLHKFYYSVTSEVTGCESPVDSFEVDVQAVDKPTGALSISYLKSDAVDGKFKDLLTQAAAKGIGLVDEVEGLTLQWYDENGEETSSVPTPEFPDASVTDDIKKTYYVSYKNELGCESDTVSVQVTIFLTPAPTVTPVHYCVKSPNPPALTADINSPNGGTYTLQWYDKEGKEKLDAAPLPDVSTVGMNILQAYVSQVSSDGAESSLVPVYVNVYGVKEPALDVANVYEYCASNQMATPLKATIVEDNANGYYSSGLVWKQEVGGVYSKLTDSPRPSLDVTENTVYKYRVYQEYVINSTNEVCVGDSIDKEVSVTFVPKVVTSEVLYLKASASDGTFTKDLLAQDGNAVTDGAGNPVAAGNLQWYADDCKTPLDKTPTPELDSNVKEGDDQTGTYCVSKKVEVSDNLTCYSEPVQISYRISDALPPLVYQYYYCEGQVMDDLSAEINPQPGKNVTDYELYWYGDQKPANTKVDPIKKGETYPMDNEAAAIQNEAVTTYTYYVAQHDKTTDAVSAAQEVKIVVYPNPVVKITDPAAVCEKEVDLSTTVAVDNKDKLTGVSTFFHTYYNSDEADLKKNMVEMSGTYKIDAYYELPLPSASNVKHKDDLICRGLMEPVKVEINQLDVPVISGVSTTCPGTAVTLTAAASSIDPKTVTFEWGGDAATTAKGGTKSEKFETINLSEETGKTYTFVVTAKAGVCEKTSEEHIVEIGDGVVSGSMALNEDGNMELEGGLVFLDAAQKTTVYSCGKPVTISVEYLGDKDYVWYDENGTKVGTGSIFTTESYATYTKKTYTVKYTNQCPTSSSVTIEAIPIVAEPLSQADINICEGEDFKVGLNYTIKEGVTPSIDWFKDDAQLGGASDKNLTVENAKAGDSGVYSYKVSNRGCSVTGTTSNVKVKPYIVASLSQIDPYIVDRHQTQTLPISYENPISGAVKYQKWYENGEEVFDGNPLVLTNVTADHKYTIVLSDPDYCDAELSAVVYVDALLQLKTELKDTMCLGTAETLVLDTTGTGNFRRPSGEPQLTIYETVGDESPININHKIVKKGDKLEIAVNPNLSAKYQISFTYNGQKEESIEEIVVIPAISLTLPPIPNICSGTETMLQVTNIQPEGTTVSWVDDPTIVEGKNSETVVVKPVFKSENSSNHQYSYIYNVVAYNSICDNSKRYQVSVLVDEPLIGEITGTAEICEGEESILEAKSYQAYEYKWRPDTAGTMTTPGVIVRPSVSTKYIVDMTRGLCSASDSFVVIVNTNPRIEKIDSVALRDRHIVLEAGYGTAPFEYQIDATDFDAKDVKTDLAFSKHVVNVRDSKGCTTSAVFTLDPPEISIPIVFTPNGDGVSDTWSIPALSEVYPNSIVSIYDRFGKLLVQFLGAEADGWDGTYNGSKLPSTDYWYLITIEEIDKEYSGHFTLIRR